MKRSFYLSLTDFDVGDDYETDESCEKDGPWHGLDERG